jgi:OOP family OmpA-OmpF porin
MRRLSMVASVVIAALVASGCAVTRQHPTACKVGAGVLGALAGGTAAGLGVGDDSSDAEHAGAAAGGVLVGGGLGLLAGHFLCQAEAAPPPPPPPPAAAPPARGTVLGEVGEAFFDFDRADLKPGARDVLAGVVKTLENNPSVRVVVEGHTDSVGSDRYNLKLSERRAEAVKAYLVRQGIDASRIATRGLGKSKPQASNATAEGRAKNRRAEIVAD